MREWWGCIYTPWPRKCDPRKNTDIEVKLKSWWMQLVIRLKAVMVLLQGRVDEGNRNLKESMGIRVVVVIISVVNLEFCLLPVFIWMESMKRHWFSMNHAVSCISLHKRVWTCFESARGIRMVLCRLMFVLETQARRLAEGINTFVNHKTSKKKICRRWGEAVL